MFCPKCKSEYVFGITTCPVCDEELVRELIEEKIEYVKFVAVFSTLDPGLLAIAKSILEDANINYLTFNEGPYESLTLQSPVIKVSDDDFEEAEELLKELK